MAQPLIIDQSNTGKSTTKLTSNFSGYPALEVDNPNSQNAQAIFGYAKAEDATGGVGVYGHANGRQGIGVQGLATAKTGTGETGGPIGVFGESSASDRGYGVFGNASAQSGINFGVFGTSGSSEGVGVYAANSAKGGDALRCEGHAMPEYDNRYNLGESKRRWKLIRGVTITPGDLVFENGVKTSEENDGLAFFNPKGTKIALLDSQGNFHIKGKIIQDLK
ncbi:MAG: hypothetical protein ABSD49_06565 [Candidatus Bathyarchaeia archaeon]